MSKDVSIHASLNALKNQPAWGLNRTVGSMFFLDIGQPCPRPGHKKVHGEWHFLVEMCHWRIEKGDVLIVGSDDDQKFIDDKFASLELGNVEEAQSLGPSYDLRLVFSSGIRLITFSTAAAANDETQWLFFCPDENVWVVKAGGIPVRGNIHEPRK
jgi:hypothetical protein